ncbi:MAG TPA: response regulator transcription factor [Patescibacteria group bacterium]
MRLLLVEDDLKIADSLKEIFTRQGLSIDLAYSKEEGFEKGLNEDYDLIILDWMLPDGDGITLCRNFRNEKVSCPILMLTAKSLVDDIALGLDSGADDYLTKPFEAKELIARIRALLRRKDQVIPDVYRLHDLEINFQTQEVTKKGKKIELSPKEYGVLEYLAKNADRVVDRNDLLTHVWDENADPFSNTVDVHIRYLRKKIDDNSKIKLINTIKGKGYRLCVN